MPLLTQAVSAVAQQTRADWQEGVYRAKLWSGEKDQYAAAISWRMTGQYSAIVETDYKFAQDIETGRPPRDLKKMLDTSQKVRRTKDGRRFLVIPFRHNLSGSGATAPVMPPGVASLAKAMASSRVTGQGTRQAGERTHLSPKTGMQPMRKQSAFLSNPSTKAHVMVAKRNYEWGARLTAGAMKQAGVSAADRKRYGGMVRMDTSTPGKKSSAYLTFRIMMEGSSGWIIPAQPGQYIAKKVADAMQPKAEAAFAEAVKRTIAG